MRMRMTILALLALVGLGGSIPAQAWNGADEASSEPNIRHFHQVTPNISRGARPEKQGLSDLAQMGVRTVIDLEDDAQAVNQERREGAQLRLNVISMPMSMSAIPNDRQ